MFDWVTARSQCSVESVYLALRETVLSDVKKMQELTPGQPNAYQVNVLTADKFIAFHRESAGGFVFDTNAVVFERLETSIHVKKTNQNAAEVTLFVAKPTLTPEGRCLLEVDGQPLYMWQASKRALEGLLFGG